MKEYSDKDLTKKICLCGAVANQVIGYTYRTTDQTYRSYRIGWYCEDCERFEEAIYRERFIE